LRHGDGKGGRIAPRRKLVQSLITLLVLATPFGRVAGAPLLGLDTGSRTLFLFGAGIRIAEFYLVLLVLLLLVFLFLWGAMLFGRVWCGWLCPQTLLCDLADWIDRKSDSLVRPKVAAALLRQLWYLLLAAAIASNLVWYFIPPQQFFVRLFSGEIGEAAGTTLSATFLLVYLDLALVRRNFCKTVCPYGRIQLLTTNSGTLTLQFDQAQKGACLGCGACLRSCPMGIDIREGEQIECINCGRCLDACRQVMEKRGGEGLIRYRLGCAAPVEGSARGKSLVLAGIIFVLAIVLGVGIATRKEATLAVQRAAGGEVRRLADGSLVNFYTVYLENRSAAPGAFTLQVPPLPGFRVELAGEVRELRLSPNANRRVDLALRISPPPSGNRELQLRLVKGDRIVARTKLPLLTR
jgi:cytochrome c oxidase accessory protein FixG